MFQRSNTRPVHRLLPQSFTKGDYHSSPNLLQRNGSSEGHHRIVSNEGGWSEVHATSSHCWASPKTATSPSRAFIWPKSSSLGCLSHEDDVKKTEKQRKNQKWFRQKLRASPGQRGKRRACLFFLTKTCATCPLEYIVITIVIALQSWYRMINPRSFEPPTV